MRHTWRLFHLLKTSQGPISYKMPHMLSMKTITTQTDCRS